MGFHSQQQSRSLRLDIGYIDGTPLGTLIAGHVQKMVSVRREGNKSTIRRPRRPLPAHSSRQRSRFSGIQPSNPDLELRPGVQRAEGDLASVRRQYRVAEILV